MTVKQLESLTGQDVGHKLFDTLECRFKQQGKTRTATCGKWPAEFLRDIRKERDAKRALVKSGTDLVEKAKADRLQKKVEAAQQIKRHYAASGVTGGPVRVNLVSR